MRARLYIVLGVASLLLGPMQGLTQYPQGGGMPGGGKGGRGGFNFDPGQMFDQMAGGKSVVTLSEITDPWQQRMIERATQALGITNGQITREQYVTYSQQRMAQRGGAVGATTPVSIVGTSPGATPAVGTTAPAPGGFGGFDPGIMAENRFRQLDKNGDGYLNSDEMPEELRTELDKWDTDKNGLIDLNEFKAFVQARVQQIFSDRNSQRGGLGLAPGAPDEGEERKPPVAYRSGKLPKELPAWFTQLDTNQDAQISLFEWRASKRSLEEFAKIDRNDDGFLTVDEVLRYEAAQGRTQQNLAAGGGTPGMPFGMVGLAPGASGMQVPMTAAPGMPWGNPSGPGRQPGRGFSGGDRGGRGPRGQDANGGDPSSRPQRGPRGGGKGFPKQGG